MRESRCSLLFVAYNGVDERVTGLLAAQLEAKIESDKVSNQIFYLIYFTRR